MDGDVVGVWKSTVPALNARAARDFVRHHVGGHECTSDGSTFVGLSLRNDKYNFAEKGTPRWRKYQGKGKRNVTYVQKGKHCGHFRWLCLDGAERHADDFPYAKSQSLDWTVFEKFQMHFAEPRHALNGGGPMTMDEFMAQDTLLRRHHHTHLRSSHDISCIAASLMRSRVPFELSVYGNATEIRSAHSEVAQAMRRAKIVVRIPGATYMSISGPMHADMLAAYAAHSVLPYYQGLSSLPSIVEPSGRYGEAACKDRTRRYSLRYITVLSSKPDRTTATLRNVWGDSPLLMVPAAPREHEASRLRALERYLLLLSRDFSVRSYWNWHPFMDFHPGACACHAADPRVRAGARHCDGHSFWLAPLPAAHLWHMFRASGLILRDCLPMLKNMDHLGIKWFVADQGKTHSYAGVMWQVIITAPFPSQPLHTSSSPTRSHLLTGPLLWRDLRGHLHRLSAASPL